jgi:threonine/homoserine/homoserine lactone efflux protein
LFSYDPDLLAAFIVFALATAISPGPNNFLLLSSGLNFGWRRSVPHALGIIVGLSIIIVIVGAGFGGYLEANPNVHSYIRWPGIVAILYFAWKIIRSNYLSSTQKKYRPFTFFEACLFQWVNPKALIIILTMIAVYTSPDYPIYGQLSVIVLVEIFSGIIATATWIMMGVYLERLFTNTRYLRVFNICMGVLLIAAVVPTIFLSGV